MNRQMLDVTNIYAWHRYSNAQMRVRYDGDMWWVEYRRKGARGWKVWEGYKTRPEAMAKFLERVGSVEK